MPRTQPLWMFALHSVQYSNTEKKVCSVNNHQSTFVVYFSIYHFISSCIFNKSDVLIEMNRVASKVSKCVPGHGSPGRGAHFIPNLLGIRTSSCHKFKQPTACPAGCTRNDEDRGSTSLLFYDIRPSISQHIYPSGFSGLN